MVDAFKNKSTDEKKQKKKFLCLYQRLLPMITLC